MSATQITMLDLAAIQASSTNPRKHFDSAALAELADSIRSKGILQPVLVRPLPVDRITAKDRTNKKQAVQRYELVAGARRCSAAKMAGLAQVPAIVRELNDREVLEVQIVENEIREDVSPLEKADGYARLVDEYDVAVEDIATKVGKSTSTIRGLLKLRQLPEKARKAVEAGELPTATAQLIARVPDAALREEFAGEVLEPGWPKADGEVLSFREAKEMLEAEYMVELKGAPFKTGDKTLLPEMGACKTCPLRVGILAMTDPETYKGVRADVCTSPECYRKKCEAQRSREREQAERDGLEVLDEAQAQALFGPSGHVNGVHWFDLADRCWDVEGQPSAKPEKKRGKPCTWGEILEGPPRINVQRYLAHDRHGTPHTLVKAVPARKALIAAGIIRDKDWAAEQPGDREHHEPNGRGVNGKPAQTGRVVLRECQSCGKQVSGLTSDGRCLACSTPAAEPEPPTKRKPTPHEINRRAAKLAGQVLYEMGANNPDGLEGLQECGDSATNAAWEALKLLCIGVAWEMHGGDGHGWQDLQDGILHLHNYLVLEGSERHQFLPPLRNWIDAAQPAELIGFLLKAFAMRLTTYPESATNAAVQAFLEWGELDWEQLQEQARRELMGGETVDAKVAEADGRITEPPINGACLPSPRRAAGDAGKSGKAKRKQPKFAGV